MPRSYISKKIRKLVFLRAKSRCEYCQCRSDVAPETFEVEHIVPTSKGGSNESENLALSCRGCNSRKSVKTFVYDPVSKVKVDLFNPRKDLWKNHFEWTADFLQITSKTEKGKITIEALKLNRPGLINIRRLMVLGGIHPPIDTL
jgi:hypothetical protein